MSTKKNTNNAPETETIENPEVITEPTPETVAPDNVIDLNETVPEALPEPAPNRIVNWVKTHPKHVICAAIGTGLLATIAILTHKDKDEEEDEEDNVEFTEVDPF